MEAEDGLGAGAFVDVVHARVADETIVRGEGVIGQVAEAVKGCAQDGHGMVLG